MTWLTTKQAATLIGISERTIQRNCATYIYRHVNGKGRGGNQLQIALESLPQAAQEKYHNTPTEYKDVLQFTGKQRDEANYRAWIVVQYKQMNLPPEDFVKWYNEENPEDPINKSKLFRWQRKYKNGEVADLIDQRGGHNRGQTSIPTDAWDYFYALYMTQQQRKIQRCYDLTKYEYPDIPSVATFERQVKKIPYLAIQYYRYGPTALNDSLPSMERSKLDINSNDIWFSDHHLIDTFVKSADGTKAVRLWLTVFFDARANRVMSFLIRNADPNSTAIKQCFRIGVEQSGAPNEVYFDNGKDYKSKYFSRDYPMSLVNQLGIGIIYATKYHGQAKTVERFFGTFTDRFSRLWPTYTGCNAKVRPECMQTSEKEIVTMAPSMEEYKNALAAYINEYNNTPSSGMDMNNQCPDKVYYDNLKVKRVVSDTDALRLLCGNSEERVIHKNGISIKNNNYFHELLLAHIGEHVMVTYDPANIDKMAIFDMDNRAICMAEAKIKTAFRHTTEEDYIRAAKQKKAARAVVKKQAPVRDMDIREIIAKNQLMEKIYDEGEDIDVVEQLTPRTTRNNKILKATDTGKTRRVNEEESVSALLFEKYSKQAMGG